MTSSFTIEVCVDSVESAVAAVRGGADRLELCSNIGLGGGTTPSMGLFKQVKRIASGARIMVMIRPRPGDFLYTPWEVDTMLEDIRAFKAAGAHGVVFGALDARGKVDVKMTTRLVREASPMEVCFHRAFDMTDDPVDAFSKISQVSGITRILTSGLGQKATTPDSLAVLQDLLERASVADTDNGALTILPGSGINPETIHDVLSTLLPHGLKEVHLSAGAWIPSAMRFRKAGMGMGVGGVGEWGIWRTREMVVRAVRTAVDEAVGTENGSDAPNDIATEESAGTEAGPEGEQETEVAGVEEVVDHISEATDEELCS